MLNTAQPAAIARVNPVDMTFLLNNEGDREMVWILLPLVLGLLLLALSGAWRTRSIERRWEHALHEQERCDPS